MKLRKNIGICLLLMSICPALHSQDKVTFQYDKAGNRISRTIVLAPRTAPAKEDEKPAVYSDMLEDIKIKIYPNPTTGLVKVEMQNLPEDQSANIWLYTMSGKLISSFKDVSNVTGINLSGQPAGVYVLKIVAGNRRTEWKIIKK